MAWQASLRARTMVAESTWELDFDLTGRRVDFAAGQYCRIELPTLIGPDRKRSRKFSIVNAPHDNGHLVVVTRTGRTGFKRTLCELPVGAPARITKVKGSLVLPDPVPPRLVFIAGGIGIAPFVSMLRDLDHRDRVDGVILLYFNRSPATAAYLAELEDLARRRGGFTLIPAMTLHPSPAGPSGRLSPELLRRVVGELGGVDYYVVGTPGMVDAGLATLDAAGVDRKHIHDEDFSGYDGSEPQVRAG